MKWYSFRGPGGSITVKGRFLAEAAQEAAARWDCDVSEVRMTDVEEIVEVKR